LCSPPLERRRSAPEDHTKAQLRDRQHRLSRPDRIQCQGNDYRLVVTVDFEKAIVWIKWIGTHKNYDKIDAKEVQHDG
jgi:mRNA-degrading endonuclease HigB of HigAB toxin-antitoxin module